MKESVRVKLEEKEVDTRRLIGLVKVGDYNSFRKSVEGVVAEASIDELYESIESQITDGLQEKFLELKGKLHEAGYL